MNAAAHFSSIVSFVVVDLVVLLETFLLVLLETLLLDFFAIIILVDPL